MKLFDRTRKIIEEDPDEFATGELPPLKEELDADALLEEVLLEEELREEGKNTPPAHSESSLSFEDPEDGPPSRPRRIRPEAIMGIIALFCAIALVAMVILCLPFMGAQEAEEDPDALLKAQHALQATEPPTTPTEELPPEETEAPTEPTVHPEANPYDRLDFQYGKNNYLYCLRQKSYIGVDVSAFQKNIDWDRVKDSGIQFAMLRLGYRGYESGKLVKDEYIDRNLEETARVGMPIGVYFFSQALTIKEVDEEIAFMMEILGDYEIHMPIVLDWEIPTSTARTAEMDRRTLTEIQRYFCKTMTEMGYTPMIYFNWYQSQNLLHLDELEDYPFWLALYQDRMTYPYKVEMWQYTDSGRVPGIAGGVDLNVYMPEE